MLDCLCRREIRVYRRGVALINVEVSAGLLDRKGERPLLIRRNHLVIRERTSGSSCTIATAVVSSVCVDVETGTGMNRAVGPGLFRRVEAGWVRWLWRPLGRPV